MTTLPHESYAQPGQPLTEQKPPHADEAIDHIFLTPRVLDAAAFTEYAESLRALIRDIDERTSRLTGVGDDTDRITRVLREAATQLKVKADAGTELSVALDKKIASANAIITRLNSSLGDEAKLTKLADEIITKRNALYRRSVEAALEPLEERYKQTEAKIKDAEERARIAEEKLTDITARFESLASQSDEIGRRANDSMLKAETRADRAVNHATEALKQLQTLAADIRTAAGEDSESIEARLGPVRNLLSDAEQILGTRDKPGSLQHAINQARENATQLGSINTDTNKQIKAAAHAHATIVDTINAATESIETLTSRRKTLCDEIEQDLESITGEISPIERATAALNQTLDDLAERTKALHTSIAEACGFLQVGESVDTSGLSTLELGENRIQSIQNAAETITQSALKQVEDAAEWLAALAAQAYPPEPIEPPKQPKAEPKAAPKRKARVKKAPARSAAKTEPKADDTA